MMPRQACCWWSGQRPQSCGQPWTISVVNCKGKVPGLFIRALKTYACASPYTSDSNVPCSGQRLRMYTLSSRSNTWASMTRRQSGQMLRVSS
jgi:hypothetical protein